MICCPTLFIWLKARAGENKDDYLKEPAVQQNQPISNLPPKPISYFSILPLYNNSAVLIVQI